MTHLNIEIKARTDHPERIEAILVAHHADYKGEDRQRDTYYKMTGGRLKLRQGNIENSLILYDRVEVEGLKKSEVVLQTLPDSGEALRQILDRALGSWVVVEKRRKIFYLDNVKFHIDSVEGLGAFVEIEACDQSGSKSEAELREQCDYYQALFGIKAEALIAKSYSDMIIDLESANKNGLSGV